MQGLREARTCSFFSVCVFGFVSYLLSLFCFCFVWSDVKTLPILLVGSMCYLSVRKLIGLCVHVCVCEQIHQPVPYQTNDPLSKAFVDKMDS